MVSQAPLSMTTNQYSFHFTCMTTPCEVVLYANNKSYAAEIASRIESNSFRLEKKYNFYSNDSFISAINTRKINHLTLDTETHKILTTVRRLSKQTEGLFDITAGTLKQCRSLATIKQVEACQKRLKSKVGINSWRIEGTKIIFRDLETQIDLGGVVKEYAVDQAGEIARQAGLSALVNFGGDIYVNGEKPDGQAFRIAIKNPKKPKQQLAIIQLKNQGLTTSAHYERSTKVEGKKYSHIIGEKTGALKILSATVISDSVLTSGIFSTSLMLNASLQLSNELGVILIDDQLRLHQNILAETKDDKL